MHVGHTGCGKPLTALQKAFEEDYHSDFSFLITDWPLGQKKVILGKFDIIKELAEQRTDRRLKKMLEKMSPNFLFYDPSKQPDFRGKESADARSLRCVTGESC